MAAHLAGQRCIELRPACLDDGVARGAHHRPAAELRDAVEQHATGLHVGDDRGTGIARQKFGGQHRQELVAPQNPSPAVDGADAVAVAVEGDAQVGALFGDRLPELRQVRRDRRVGMMRGETAVDRPVQDDMPARQPPRHRGDHLAGGAVARVPDHGQVARPPVAGQEPRHIGGLDVDVDRMAVAGDPVAGRRQRPETGDIVAPEGGLAEHHLETVMVRRIMRAGDHDAGIRLQRMDRVIQRRAGPAADPQGDQPRGGEPFDQRRLEFRRGDPAVVTDRDVAAAAARHDGAEAAPQRVGVAGAQRLAHDAADIVFAQDNRGETVSHVSRRPARPRWDDRLNDSGTRPPPSRRPCRCCAGRPARAVAAAS